MTDIRPDLSGPEPRCSVECPHFDIERRQRGPDWYDEDGICRHESAMREPGKLCLPYVRHIVQNSRRRWVSFRFRTPVEPGEYQVLAELDDGTVEEQTDTWSEREQWTGWQRGLAGAVIAWGEK